MKRFLSLILIILIVPSLFQACSPVGMSLKINDVSVGEEIYNYYLSDVENNDEYKDSKNKKDVAIELCKKYVAGLELIESNQVSLTAEEKVSVSGKTKAKWLYFKDFYKKYSVSKQTLNSMLEYEQLIEDLIVKMYSEDGEDALSEKEIKKYYNKNYVVAQVISADFKDENGNYSDDETIADITEKFTDMRNFVRRGDSMENAAQKYPEFAEYEGNNTVIASFDSSYPKDLFKKASALKKGETQVYKYSEIIYLIHRSDSSEDKKYFSLYKKDCIIRMKKDEFEKKINTLAESYKTVYNKR